MDSPTLLGRLALVFTRRYRLTILLWVMLLGFGLVAFTGALPREGFPSVQTPLVVASGSYFVDDPEQLDEEVVRPLVAAASSVDEVREVTSFARASTYAMLIELDSDVSSKDGVTLIQAAVDRAPSLPDGAQVELLEIDAARFLAQYDLLVSVYGDDTTSADELQAGAQLISDELAQSAAIRRSEVEELLTTGVNPLTGDEETRQTRFTRVGFDTSDGGASDVQFFPAITIGVVGEGGQDQLELETATTDRIEELRAEGVLGDGSTIGLDATVSADFAGDIRNQLSSLQSNVRTGLLAVVVVSFVLIGWRAALVTALFMVTVLASVLAVMLFVGVSLNTITLFALILTVGLLVDDAIVITEAIDANKASGANAFEVVADAIRQVGAASFAGTATTVLVFAPMLFVSGLLGEFIRLLPLTVMLALSLSLLLSLTLIPFLSRVVLLRGDAHSRGPLGGVEEWLGERLASLPLLFRDRRARGWAVAGGAALLSLVAVMASFALAGRAGFDIFPEADDSDILQIDTTFEPGTGIEEAEAITADVADRMTETLGAELVEGLFFAGTPQEVQAQLRLARFQSRGPTAPALADQAQMAVADIEGARVNVVHLSPGPPEEEFPFAVQIFGNTDTTSELARDIRTSLEGATITRPNGTTFTVVETEIANPDAVSRIDGRRYLEVRAKFDDSDVTAMVGATRDQVEAEFPADALVARGLDADALEFDFGFETQNAESFQSTIVAFFAALALMLVLLVVQFNSLTQPLLIFIAIPLSLFGVMAGLVATGNPLSFFVMIGLIGLVGIVVNNTILLTDTANQLRAQGADRVEAISRAVRRRFRPLVATSLTTMAGLLPLALADPFWEPLAFTIIFGLLSSTTLVLVSFPYAYLGIEWFRDLLHQRAGVPR